MQQSACVPLSIYSYIVLLIRYCRRFDAYHCYGKNKMQISFAVPKQTGRRKSVDSAI